MAVRLRTVSPTDVGWTRRRVGRGFSYLDQHGQRLSAVDAERVVALVIPPAWEQVWICSLPNGHIQAVGTDAKGRRQYIYHPDWRLKRDLAKHERVLTVARRLPNARVRALADLKQPGMPVERALATAFRLLDLGYFRIGSDSYATENGSYGLTTLLREHVHREERRLVFEFLAKSGKTQHIEIADPLVLASVETMRRRRGDIDTLLAYRDGRRWARIDADDVNDYLRGLLGHEVSAKDFRTWHGTVHAAVALGRAADRADSAKAIASPTAIKRAVAAAMREVAEHLGNTPTVARASYVDPRLIDLFGSGTTIGERLARIDKLRDLSRRQASLERAVIKLLSTPRRSRS